MVDGISSNVAAQPVRKKSYVSTAVSAATVAGGATIGYLGGRKIDRVIISAANKLAKPNGKIGNIGFFKTAQQLVDKLPKKFFRLSGASVGALIPLSIIGIIAAGRAIFGGRD